MKNLRVVAAQINPIVGDIKCNTANIIADAISARDELQADVVIFPELALTGYPPEDLLLRPELYVRAQAALKIILQRVKNIHVILGLPTKIKNNHYNSAVVVFNGKVRALYHKQLLPNYGVFDEKRYFTAGNKTCVVAIKGIKVGIAICEDVWFKEPILNAKKAGAQLVISLNASPFDMNKPFIREQILSKRAHESKIPIIYVNTVGGQDELIFDGGSIVVNSRGEVTQRAPFFTTELMPIDIALGATLEPTIHPLLPISNIPERVYQALVLGVRDYVNKNHFKGAVIGASGGIDSALTMAIAVDALGKDRVEVVYMPSRYSSNLSQSIVEEEAEILGIKHHIVSIEPIFKQFLASATKAFNQAPKNIVAENLQARCRGTLLMAFSNQTGAIVLSTGNKSEMAVGYATLYGDMAGGFCVLKDVPKTLVYMLSHYRNGISHVIPDEAITRPPSAELAPNQKDTDSLPPYPILDEILERYIEQDQSATEIAAAGFAHETVQKVICMVNHNEYKRRQAPPGIRITARAFGRDRRYPITSGF